MAELAQMVASSKTKTGSKGREKYNYLNSLEIFSRNKLLLIADFSKRIILMTTRLWSLLSNFRDKSHPKKKATFSKESKEVFMVERKVCFTCCL